MLDQVGLATPAAICLITVIYKATYDTLSKVECVGLLHVAVGSRLVIRLDLHSHTCIPIQSTGRLEQS